ncbi:MAG: Crp/Fnr family transcriptional regulator [Rhizobiaceae bacterium]
MLSQQEIDCLKKTDFFGALPQEVFEHLLAHAHVIKLKTGTEIFHQGDEAHAVYCVVKGVIKLSVASKNGDTVVVDIFHPGSSFAEMMAFRDVPYPVTATALADSRVVAIPKSLIRHELKTNPVAYSAVLTAAYTHLHRLIRQVEQLKAASGLERVAGFVLAHAEKETNSCSILIPYEKQTLASMLGIKPETLSRAFKRLEGHGLAVRGPIVEIRNRSALEKFLNES